MLVQEQERRERLVLRRGGDIALGREPAEERRHLRRAHLRRMTLAVKVDEVADAVPVRLLRAAAVASRADRAPQPIDQAFLPAVRRNARIPSRFRAIAHPRSDNTANATPSNPNAVIRKGVDTPPNKTGYDIRRLNRLLNVSRLLKNSPNVSHDA